MMVLVAILRALKNVQFWSRSRKAKFEPDAEIGQKGAFWKGFIFLAMEE